jgi:hypothetical protein
MTELEFSRDEVERLAGRLARLDLSERERELLLALFWAAAEGVCEVKPEAAEDPNELREQLVRSFVPGSGQKFLIHSLRVGHRPRRVGHSPWG